MTRLEEINERLSAIAAEAETDGADLDALTEEVRSLKEEKAALEAALEKRQALRRQVAEGAGTVTRRFAQEGQEEPYGIASEEYRSAWIRRMQGKKLTDAEQRAFDSTGGAIATMTANAILTVVRDHAPLLDRLTVLQSASAISYYVEGTNSDAADHTENAAITAATDTLTKVDLKPAEIVKLIQVSDAARAMSVPAFESWLAKNLGEAIARKINAKIITALSTAATSAGTTLAAATVQALLGSVKGDGVALLCNRKTLYTGLLPLQDNAKSSIVRFEGAAATVYGVDVLVDDNVADSTVIAGDLTRAIAALGEDITVRQQYDIDTNSYKYLGVALFDVEVGLDEAFAKLAPGA